MLKLMHNCGRIVSVIFFFMCTSYTLKWNWRGNKLKKKSICVCTYVRTHARIQTLIAFSFSKLASTHKITSTNTWIYSFIRRTEVFDFQNWVIAMHSKPLENLRILYIFAQSHSIHTAVNNVYKPKWKSYSLISKEFNHFLLRARYDENKIIIIK